MGAGTKLGDGGAYSLVETIPRLIITKDINLVPQNTAASVAVLSISVRGSHVRGPLFLIGHAPLPVKARRL